MGLVSTVKWRVVNGIWKTNRYVGKEEIIITTGFMVLNMNVKGE